MCRRRIVRHYALSNVIQFKMLLFKVFYIFLLFVSQIVSLFIDNRKIYYFSVYISFGLIYEFLYAVAINKTFLINGYIVFSILYFGYFYYSNISNKKLKVFVRYFVMANIAFLFYFLSSQTYKLYNQPMILFLCVYTVILSLLFFVDMIIKPRATKLMYEFPFWVSCGLLFWATMFIFNIGAIYYLNNTDRVFLRLLQIGFYLTNIVVYTIYLYGMISIWSIENKKT